MGFYSDIASTEFASQNVNRRSEESPELEKDFGCKLSLKDYATTCPVKNEDQNFSFLLPRQTPVPFLLYLIEHMANQNDHGWPAHWLINVLRILYDLAV